MDGFHDFQEAVFYKTHLIRAERLNGIPRSQSHGDIRFEQVARGSNVDRIKSPGVGLRHTGLPGVVLGEGPTVEDNKPMFRCAFASA